MHVATADREQGASMRASGVLSTTILAAGALISGCASRAPPRNDQLEQARISVRSLEQDPDAQAVAARQLRDAQADLKRANDAFEKHESAQEVTRLAYLAGWEADTGKAAADEHRARRELALASGERSQQPQNASQQAQSQAPPAAAGRAEAQRAQNELQQEQQELSQLKTRQTERGLELTLASDLLFSAGSAELKSGATLQINRLANFMRGNPKTRVIIEGYTDSTGTAAFNEELSAQRAQAVASALGMQGIAMSRITAIGRGQSHPAASNATPAGRQQNRRVDVILSNMSGRFAQGATGGPVIR